MKTVGLLLAVAFVGCNASETHPGTPAGVTLQRLTVTSKTFPSNGAIPVDSTCDGADRSPQLTWSAPPQGTAGFAIVADDPDAPGGDFTHWIVSNVRGDVRALPEGGDPAEVGATVGTNGFNRPGYSGPCPPRMEQHRYYFRVYALDAAIDPKAGSTREGLDAAMSGHVLAEGAVMGTFAH
ncbi:MAG TPA: YbhB/YbcL family Raf kinase inhibitor-like protein [Polyangiaceae bacterium]|jgi:hypothetical protein